MRSLLLSLFLAVPGTWAIWEDLLGWQQYPDGSDLQNFVTRPEFKPPRYMVAKHHPEAITPGYWFVTPYTRLGVPPKTEQKDYLACMTGAHIYDGDGELVWSGSCRYGNRNVFSLRPIHINGSDFITFYLPREHGVMVRADERVPHAVVMNDRYEEVSRSVPYHTGLDGHEFYLQPDGNSALMSTRKVLDVDASQYGLLGGGKRRVVSTGFQELDLETNLPIFDWDPLASGIKLSESCDQVNKGVRSERALWDFMHINSVHKTQDNDYIISGRHLSAIYRISGKDGHIMWKLGGCDGKSSFAMENGVAFHWQHHARIRSENETHTIVSVFDNASDDADRGEPKGHDPPVAKIIILDTVKMTAKMLRRFDCPDQTHQTPALGSFLLLGDDPEKSNVFVNWAFQGYISEYDGDNRLLLEAKFMSDRKRTMRAYKAPFKAYPSTDELVLKVLPIGFGQGQTASAFYVSWNGATEVASWAFYGSDTEQGDNVQLLATVPRRGFETSWVMPGVVHFAYAEALDINGVSLGKSLRTTITPAVDPLFKLAYPALNEDPGIQPQSLPHSNLPPAPNTAEAYLAALHAPYSTTRSVDFAFILFVAGLSIFAFYAVGRPMLYKYLRRSAVHSRHRSLSAAVMMDQTRTYND